MTDQELADAIRAHYGADLWPFELAANIFGLLKELPVVPDPPTIDQVPGWTVHLDARGEQFAHFVGWATYRRFNHPDGLPPVPGAIPEGPLHPWPDPPLHQPGDPVDVLWRDNWSHLGRSFVGVRRDGWIVVEDSGGGLGVIPPDEVRPHVTREITNDEVDT